jgi:hypothetical protein
METLELKLGSDSDAVIVVSTEEVKILTKKLPGRRLGLISMIHDVQSVIPPFSARQDCLFVGGFEHTPNVDAMLWFAAEIMPLIHKQLPQARLHIVGSKMPEGIRALASEHILTHGYVECITPFLESCLVSVAPLRFGAGVKGKITESMSYGLPVVSTTVGAEGMRLTRGKNILVADEPAAFAEHVVRLQRDSALWEKLSENGLKVVQEHFSMAAAKHNLEQLLLDLHVLPAVVRKKSTQRVRAAARS